MPRRHRQHIALVIAAVVALSLATVPAVYARPTDTTSTASSVEPATDRIGIVHEHHVDTTDRPPGPAINHEAMAANGNYGARDASQNARENHGTDGGRYRLSDAAVDDLVAYFSTPQATVYADVVDAAEEEQRERYIDEVGDEEMTAVGAPARRYRLTVAQQQHLQLQQEYQRLHQQQEHHRMQVQQQQEHLRLQQQQEHLRLQQLHEHQRLQQQYHHEQQRLHDDQLREYFAQEWHPPAVPRSPISAGHLQAQTSPAPSDHCTKRRAKHPDQQPPSPPSLKRARHAEEPYGTSMPSPSPEGLALHRASTVEYRLANVGERTKEKDSEEARRFLEHIARIDDAQRGMEEVQRDFDRVASAMALGRQAPLQSSNDPAAIEKEIRRLQERKELLYSLIRHLDPFAEAELRSSHKRGDSKE